MHGTEQMNYGSIEPFQVEGGVRAGEDGYWGDGRSSYEALANDSTINEEDTEEAEYSSHYISRAVHPKTGHSPIRNRRWSVMEKLEKRHYCRIRSCADCGRILNCKCMLATCMLGIFIVMAVTFAHVLFFATEVGSVRFDYIVVGAGPAGSLLANRLVGGGATVLLLESGNYTQYEVRGRDYFAGPVSRFDIPFLWPAVSQFSDFLWRSTPLLPSSERRDDPSDDDAIIQAKGVGGNGILSSMVYMRALPGDIKRWGSSKWTWERMLGLYRTLEHFDDSNGDIHAPAPQRRERTLAGEELPGSSAEPEVRVLQGDRRTEDSLGSSSRRSSGDLIEEIHGTCDPGSADDYASCDRIVTAPPSMVDLLSSLFLSAAKATGIGRSTDFNDHTKPRIGAGLYHFNIADGVRDSAARRFLRPILGAPGLVLEVGASVTQILMTADVSLNSSYPAHATDPPAYRAIGVEFVQNGELKQAFLRNAMIPEKLQAQFDPASRGVVVTAGAMMTPMVLIKSGVGPEDKLREAGVEPKVISEGVGRSLRDHPVVAVVVRMDEHVAAALPSSYDFLSALPDYVQTIHQGRANDATGAYTGVDSSEYGVLGSPGIAAGAFLRSPLSSEGDDDEPDIQLTVYPFVPEQFSRLVAEDGAGNSNSDEPDRSRRQKHRDPRASAGAGKLHGAFMTVTVSLLRPDASMEVFLNATDDALPALGPSSSSSSSSPGLGASLSRRDVSRLFWGLSQARTILSAAPLSNHTAAEVTPGAGVDSDQALRGWIRQPGHFFTGNNWCGSVHMGPPSDPSSALDEMLRVKGVQDLRVADSSALPALPSGNLQATVLALAEFVAGDILASKKK